MVSKKDFIAAAKIIKGVKEDWRGGTPVECLLNYLEEQFADYFEAENGMFDRAKFINACELEN